MESKLATIRTTSPFDTEQELLTVILMDCQGHQVPMRLCQKEMSETSFAHTSDIIKQAQYLNINYYLSQTEHAQ